MSVPHHYASPVVAFSSKIPHDIDALLTLQNFIQLLYLWKCKDNNHSANQPASQPAKPLCYECNQISVLGNPGSLKIPWEGTQSHCCGSPFLLTPASQVGIVECPFYHAWFPAFFFTKKDTKGQPDLQSKPSTYRCFCSVIFLGEVRNRKKRVFDGRQAENASCVQQHATWLPGILFSLLSLSVQGNVL